MQTTMTWKRPNHAIRGYTAYIVLKKTKQPYMLRQNIPGAQLPAIGVRIQAIISALKNRDELGYRPPWRATDAHEFRLPHILV